MRGVDVSLLRLGAAAPPQFRSKRFTMDAISNPSRPIRSRSIALA
jgi:hypothetical protein